MESDTRKKRCWLVVGAVALLVLGLASSVWADDLIVDPAHVTPLVVSSDITYTNEYIGGATVVGRLNQTSGTNTVNWDLYVGPTGFAVDAGGNKIDSGYYDLEGGSLWVANAERIGGNDTPLNGGPATSGGGLFLQGGGTHTVQNYLRLGDTSGSDGGYVMSGGSLSTYYLDIGNSGNGVFIHGGGTTTVGDSLTMGVNSGSTGSYFLNGGTLNGGIETIGNSGGAVFYHEKGTNTATNLTLASNPGSSGTYTMYDGSLSADDLKIGGKGTGSFTQTLSADPAHPGTGGSVNANTVSIGTDPSGTGTYTMDKGTLTTKDLTVGSNGTLNLTSPSANVYVSQSLIFEPNSHYTGVPTGQGFGTFHLTGANVYILSNQVDMSTTALSFENPHASDILDVEVPDFYLGELDLVDHAALTLFGKDFYVGILSLGMGSTLNLNDVALFLRQGEGWELLEAGYFDGRIVNNPVPVPGSLLLLGSGLLGLGGWRRFRKG